MITGVTESTLRTEGLSRLYGKKRAVDGAGFTMKTGEVVGLLGPNGAGKTTIFYMIAGFLKPTSGRVLLDEVDIGTLPMFRRARLGICYLPQESSIFRRMTVEQNLFAILETRPGLDKAARRERADELMEEFGITRIARQMAYTLSGGERRRAEIARALALDPKFLLLDEPFTGIDPIAIHEIKKIIKQLSAEGIGVLITDHNVRDTLDITDRSHIIHLGRIIVSGGREEVLGSEEARSLYLGEEFRM